ncbi:MAG: rhodanese-like domain-containing protein [Spirochaetes bacterium]|jgi:rhodanese-related sulfurtransferase|nr:rhodanese-like domain-containing protein [Spirochaetota bacterium]
MTRRVGIFVILSVFLIGAGAVAQRSDGDGSGTREDISRYRVPANLVELVETGGREFIVVDVRTPAEYRSGHIPGAVNIDHRQIGERPPEVDREALIVTYCRSGARASRAQATLERMGFENVVNFGGVASWPEELVTGDSPR